MARSHLVAAALLAAVAAVVAADAAVTILRASVPVARAAPSKALDRPLPRLALRDARGRATSLAAFRGRWLILAPVATRCRESCPLTTGALLRIRGAVRARGLGDRVVVAAATVDARHDSPRRLRAFRRRTGADLALLTGTRTQIRRLWRFFGVHYAPA